MMASRGGTGGGIVGEVTLTNSTVSNNYASLSTGGIEGGGVIGNTILNNNSGANITGTIKSLGYNLSSDDGGGNLTGARRPDQHRSDDWSFADERGTNINS